jgi:hypothetical protein
VEACAIRLHGVTMKRHVEAGVKEAGPVRPN